MFRFILPRLIFEHASRRNEIVVISFILTRHLARYRADFRAQQQV